MSVHLGGGGQIHYPHIKLILEENKRTTCLSSPLKTTSTTEEDLESPNLFRFWPQISHQQTKFKLLKFSINANYFWAYQWVLPLHGNKSCISRDRGAAV